MRAINKIDRILTIVFLTIGDILYAAIGWLLICAISHMCNIYLNRYIYFVIVLLLILRSVYHRSKWYVCTTPTKILCERCHTTVSLTRYREEEYFNYPFTISIILHPLSSLIESMTHFYMAVYRPYLQLECPNCEEKQVVCPYCHQFIDKEAVECHYDKPSKCPHCGKKIYTLMHMSEWKKGVICIYKK